MGDAYASNQEAIKYNKTCDVRMYKGMRKKSKAFCIASFLFLFVKMSNLRYVTV